ncbi:MAG: AAA family ATPase [Lachnospiraceae bacterium]|nr:AAA family ATPase [Lachnospiraceae bacterium]
MSEEKNVNIEVNIYVADVHATGDDCTSSEFHEETINEVLELMEGAGYDAESGKCLVTTTLNYDLPLASALLLLPKSMWDVYEHSRRREILDMLTPYASLLTRYFSEYLYDINVVLAVTKERKKIIIGLSGCDNPFFEDMEIGNFTRFSTVRLNKQSFINAENIRDIAAGWLRIISAKEMRDYIATRVIGQDKAVGLFSISVCRYIQALAEDHLIRSNVMISGPSGSGKTECLRALKDYFKEKNISLPVIRIDLGDITGNGFKGEDTDYIISSLMDCNRGLGGYGIVAIDEFDKRCTPSYTTRGMDANREVQGQLLNLIEGMNYPKFNCNTARTMFVGIGSFQPLRDEKVTEAGRTTIGFGSSRDEHADELMFRSVSMDQMIDYGMMPELAGRFSVLINMTKITEEVMGRIVITKARDLMNELHTDIHLSTQAICQLTDIAYSKRGIRSAMSTLKQLCYEALAECIGDTTEPDSIYIDDLSTSYACNKIQKPAM